VAIFMKNFKFGNRSRDRKDFPRRNSGGGDSRRPSLHDAVCDECGKDCQVPFRPSGDKPIYCSECFEKKGGRESNRPNWRGSRSRNFDDRDRGSSSQNNISDRSTSQLIEKIEILNTKLETIINLLSSVGEKKSGSVEGRTEKNKKSNSTKADKNTEALTLVEKKDTDLTVDNAQENIKSKPQKRARTKVDSSIGNRV
jgi:CxxC-x17-CxxC domain-containing protein